MQSHAPSPELLTSLQPSESFDTYGSEHDDGAVYDGLDELYDGDELEELDALQDLFSSGINMEFFTLPSSPDTFRAVHNFSSKHPGVAVAEDKQCRLYNMNELTELHSLQELSSSFSNNFNGPSDLFTACDSLASDISTDAGQGRYSTTSTDTDINAATDTDIIIPFLVPDSIKFINGMPRKRKTPMKTDPSEAVNQSNLSGAQSQRGIDKSERVTADGNRKPSNSSERTAWNFSMKSGSSSQTSINNKQLVLPRESAHTQTLSWVSQDRADQNVWERTLKHFGYMKLTSPFVPRDFRTYLTHKVEFLQSMQDRERRKIEILAAQESENFPKVTVPCMNGATFEESRGAVLSENTDFFPLSWKTEEERSKEAHWPSVAEMKWDGDDRLTNSAYGRYLPVPRTLSYDWRLGVPTGGGRGRKDAQPIWDGVGLVPWQERKFIAPPAFDSFWASVDKRPDEEMIFDRVEEIKGCDEAGMVGWDLLKALEGTGRY